MRVMLKSASKAISKFFRKHGTKLLVAGACAGTVGAVVEGIRVTPKAMERIDEAETEKGEELTIVEKVKVAGPVYLPCGILALQSVACVIGCEVIHRKKEVALIGALTTTKTAYDEYRQIARDIKVADSETGEEVSVDQKVRDGLAKKHVKEDDIPDYKIYGDYSEGMYKCKDHVTGQYFWSNKIRIEKAALDLNNRMYSGQEECISHSEFLEECGGGDCDIGKGYRIKLTGEITPTFGTCEDKEGRPCIEMFQWNEPSERYDIISEN